MIKCDIIIPVWNQLKATKICLKSLFENTNFPYRLIIIDNGSEKKTKEFLEDFVKQNREQKIELYRNEENEGFVKAVNRGMKAGNAEYICILNNDTIVTNGWLSEMVSIGESSPKIGIINPSSNNLGQKPGKNVTIEAFLQTMIANKGKYADLGTALGFCMLIKKEVVKRIGLLDEIYSPGNFEDTDFSLRAREAGYTAVRSMAAYVYHKENTSFNILKGYKRGFERNKKIFESRWGIQKRILFIKSDNLDKACKEKIIKKLKPNNWVYIASKNAFDFQSEYSRLKTLHFKGLFTLKVLLKILFKKKRYDEIYCDDTSLYRFISLLKPFHKASVSRI